MHNKRSIRFSGMNSWSQNYGSTDGYFFRPWCEICNDDHFAVVSGNCFAQNGFSYFVLLVRCTYFCKVFGAITVSIGIAMSEVYFVVVMLESNREGQSEIESTTLFLHAILIVADVISFSEPSDTRTLLSLSLWICKRFHPLIIRTFRLD